MDDFNIVWCALWSDVFMAQHQLNTERLAFKAPTDLGEDFLFYLTATLGDEKTVAYFTNNDKRFVSVKLTRQEVEKVTDWIIDFNLSTRNPAGLVVPDLYLGEDRIRGTTVNVYCNIITQVIAYMLKHQSAGRDKIAKWAAENFMLFYAQAYGEAIKAKTPAG